MDIPVKLLKKNLPKQRTQGQNKPAEPVPAGDVDSEAAIFMQAMQGMVTKKAGASGKKSFMPVSDDAAEAQAACFPLKERRAFKKMQKSAQAAAPAVDSSAAAVSTTLPTPNTPTKLSIKEAMNDSPVDAGDNDFALAMRTVEPLKGKGREIMPEVLPAELVPGMSLQDLLEGEIVFDVALNGENVQGHVVGLDEKTVLKLVSGQYSPEARLDLHGLNASQAFQSLVPFFRSAWHKGLRSVIVVTGRGLNSPTGMAVLRDKLHSWLTQEPFNRVVIAFSTARPCDGGTGSMYVLLRKFRKKHKVHWQRTPADSDLF